MKQHAAAEAHVLDRIMYLLEERSVSSLAVADRNFAKFVGELYEVVQGKASELRTA